MQKEIEVEKLLMISIMQKKTFKTFFKKIRDGKIEIEETRKSNLKEIKKVSHKSNVQKSETLCNTRKEIIKLFEEYSTLAKYKKINRK